ncbi:hypothetical protein Afe04nite_20740 [Asanoa ferruginea]|nr:hypothetical protein Afe04nite_20740 [Asanoa ferruginea]
MLDRALLNADLIDTIEVLAVFPMISSTTGVDRIFDGAADFDLELRCRHRHGAVRPDGRPTGKSIHHP